MITRHCKKCLKIARDDDGWKYLPDYDKGEWFGHYWNMKQGTEKPIAMHLRSYEFKSLCGITERQEVDSSG